MFDQAADMVVHRFEHAGIDLHAGGVEFLLFRRKGVPGAEVGRHRREGGICGHVAAFLGALPPCGAGGVPAGIIHAGIVGGEFRGSLHRDVDGHEGEVGEERRFGVSFVHISHHLVDDEFGGIEVVRQAGRHVVLVPRRVRVVGHVGLVFPVVGAGGVQREGPVKAVGFRQIALAAAEVPLAGHQRAVAEGLQAFGERGDAGLEAHGVAGLAFVRLGQDFGDGGDAGQVVVHAGEEHRARRRAERRGIVAGEQRAARGQRINVRSARFAAIGAEIHEGGVVDDQDDDVRARRRRFCLRRGFAGRQEKRNDRCHQYPHHSLPICFCKHVRAAVTPLVPGPIN